MHQLRATRYLDLMHFAIDAIGAKHGGGGQVLVDLVEGLDADERVSRITVYCSPLELRRFRLSASEKVVECYRPFQEGSRLRRFEWYSRGLASTSAGAGAQAVLCANGLGVGRGLVPTVSLVQQSLPFCMEAKRTLPLRRRFEIALIRKYMANSCRSAHKVFVQSNVMRSWVAQAFNLDEDSLGVLYPRPGHLPHSTIASAEKHSKVRPTLLYVGSDSPYKNLELVARAMKSLREQVPEAVLRCTVKPGSHFEALEGVKPTGFLDRAQLAQEYAGCDVVVQPSLVESGPLIPPEAMSMHRPLLVADRPWARDTCQNAAIYFDPSSEADFVEKAVQLISSSQLRESIVENGAQLLALRQKEAGSGSIVSSLIDAAVTR